jgi:AcrR family transcriptional regulator
MTTDRAEQRRAARRAENRADILDAAERVFAAHGIQAGSIRKIGAESGFSAAAIYTFFDNKEQLLAETLARRGDELVTAIATAAAAGADALDSLHHVIDVTVDYFEARPDFARIVRHLRGGVAAGPALGGLGSGSPLFDRATGLLTDLVSTGQATGQVRAGNPRAIAHLYEVLIHEHVVLTAASIPTAATLSRPELHDFIDGALRPRATS